MPQLVRRTPKIDAARREQFLGEAEQVDEHAKTTLCTDKSGGKVEASHLEVWKK